MIHVCISHDKGGDSDNVFELIPGQKMIEKWEKLYSLYGKTGTIVGS